MKDYSAADVDAYIAATPPEARPKLNELRELVRKTIPEADESISYGMPFYKYYGLLAGFAAHKSHASIWFPVGGLPEDDRASLEAQGYGTGKKTVKIGFDQPVPTAIIERILRDEAAANEARKAMK